MPNSSLRWFERFGRRLAGGVLDRVMSRETGSDQEPGPAGGGHELDWRVVVAVLPDPAVVIDRDRMVLCANTAAVDGFSSVRIGGPVALLTRAPELAEAIDQTLADGSPRSVMLRERVPVDRRLDAAISPLPPRTAAGAPAILIVLRDVSEREQLAQMRADFVAHASHELRTPLAAVRGFIETLQGPAHDDAVARERFLGIMARESLRMTRILDDLLSLARLEMRAHLTPQGRVGILAAVEGVVTSLEPIATAAGSRIVVDAPPREVQVRGDRDEIVQMLVNLVQNAVKYGRSGGTVTVKVTVPEGPGQRISIAVSDEGPGIAPQHIPRLTERFYRVDDKSSREKGGTGLGLAIVKHILARHRGELRIASTLGVGSTFTVELPRAEKNNSSASNS